MKIKAMYVKQGMQVLLPDSEDSEKYFHIEKVKQNKNKSHVRLVFGFAHRTFAKDEKVEILPIEFEQFKIDSGLNSHFFYTEKYSEVLNKKIVCKAGILEYEPLIEMVKYCILNYKVYECTLEELIEDKVYREYQPNFPLVNYY